MGRSGVSSRRKHSKKKSLKVSSEDRRKKRSGRNKSKKLPRHDDSFSSSSDDTSTSSSLISSSSLEGEYKSRRSRSHTRTGVKGSRKRSRRRSLSEESSEDLDSPPVKKKKGSKKKADSQRRKKHKKIKKKKPRKEAYISSSSCSTCRDGESSSDEGSSFGRPRGRSREKKKDHRDSTKGRNGRRKNRSRSRSSSPSKLSNSYDDDSIEKVAVENQSRRLKSVITVAKLSEDEEGNDLKKDELKEATVYDYDDYPSCKSNDSNDGENKKETIDHSNVSPEKRILTSVIGEVNSDSSLKDNKPVSPGKNAGKECVGSKVKESNASGTTGSEVDNLESILRQKALENLSRFRGGLQTKAVVPVENKHKIEQSGVKQSSSSSFNLVQTPSRPPALEQDGASMTAVTQPVIPRSRFTWRRDPSATTGKEEKTATESGSDSGRPQAPAPKLHGANLSSTHSAEKSKIMANTNNIVGGIETNDGQKTNAALETSSGASAKEGSSKGQQTETNNSSQFEKKTMSVMRGGEMVQVSYKVYIPTRAPALARRQLKR